MANSMLICIVTYVTFKHQLAMCYIFAFEIKLNRPHANGPIAPPFKFVRVYFKKKLLSQNACAFVCTRFLLYLTVMAYSDLQVVTGQSATIRQSYFTG